MHSCTRRMVGCGMPQLCSVHGSRSSLVTPNPGRSFLPQIGRLVSAKAWGVGKKGSWISVARLNTLFLSLVRRQQQQQQRYRKFICFLRIAHGSRTSLRAHTAVLLFATSVSAHSRSCAFHGLISKCNHVHLIPSGICFIDLEFLDLWMTRANTL